jgi:hypothetical protein
MTPTPMTAAPSGLTVDGIAIPLAVESDGGEAIAAYVAAQHEPPAPADPNTTTEGEES